MPLQNAVIHAAGEHKLSTAGSQPAAVWVRRATRTENHPPHAYHGYAPTCLLSHPKLSNTTNSRTSAGGPQSGSVPWVVRSTRCDLAQETGGKPGPAPSRHLDAPSRIGSHHPPLHEAGMPSASLDGIRRYLQTILQEGFAPDGQCVARRCPRPVPPFRRRA